MIRPHWFPSSGNAARAEQIVRDLAPRGELARHPAWREMVSIVGTYRAVLFTRQALARRNAIAKPRTLDPDRIWKDQP